MALTTCCPAEGEGSCGLSPPLLGNLGRGLRAGGTSPHLATAS